ncbi:MAG TPA: diguanylate cyclase [Crinalium sp.]|jgi:diguanylate cyclase (GGDEF)-like protein
MITSLNIQYSQKSDLLKVQRRFKQHPHEKILIQVFSGRITKTEIERILDDIKDVFQGVPIIGTTTAGEIVDANVEDNTVVVNFCFFDSTTVRTTFVDYCGDLWQDGKTLARDLISVPPQALILLGCGLKDGRTIDATALLSALYEEFPKTVIAGAQAGDNGHGVISYVFTENGIIEHGAVAASLSGERLSVHNSYNLSWVPIGKKLTITKAVGSRVYSIDNRSPLELYNHYLGPEVVEGLPLAAADFPLVIERDGIPMAVHARGVNDDGSFDYIHSFHSGEQVQFGFCHAGLLAIAAKQTFDALRAHPAQVAFIYSCVSRKWILGQDINIEIAPISKLATTAGFFAYGEYFTHPTGKCLFFSQTMTVLTLAELDGTEHSTLMSELKPLITEEESKQLKTLRVLHRLVETSATEIETINHKLSEMAHEDCLTGLFNRRHFDQHFTAEFKRAQRSGEPLSLILIDVDAFKLYNDTYGHVKGDSCLRAVAGVLKEIPQRPGDFVSRYGGEEFICILPNTDFEGAMFLAEKIRYGVSKLSIPHLTSSVSNHLTVSIGVQTVEQVTEQRNPEMIVMMCDEQLYAAKMNGRNRIYGNSAAQ